jgi:hypothetical protein
MLWGSQESAPWSELSEALRANPEWGNNPLTQEEAELDIRNSGFLVRDLDDRWRFNHRSILEYFAARAELSRLASGERPRYVPTDGYRLFLCELIAKHWLMEGQPPLYGNAWHISRGREVLANQWSLLAAATSVLPEGRSVALSGASNIESESGVRWSATHFNRLALTVVSGHVEFTGCTFSDSRINARMDRDAILIFEDCKFVDTTLHFLTFPGWTTVFDATNPQAIDVPVAVLDFSSYVEAGATVRIGDSSWTLGRAQLAIFLECARRLKGKTYKHNFLRGAYAQQLEGVLPSLIQAGLVDEDSSRQAHQLTWTSRGRALSTKLRTDPMAAQAEVAALFS